MRTINILSKTDVEDMCKDIIDKRLTIIESVIDKLRLRVNELDNLVCDVYNKKRKYVK